MYDSFLMHNMGQTCNSIHGWVEINVFIIWYSRYSFNILFLLPEIISLTYFMIKHNFRIEAETQSGTMWQSHTQIIKLKGSSVCTELGGGGGHLT